jgi:hypothetical protein
MKVNQKDMCVESPKAKPNLGDDYDNLQTRQSNNLLPPTSTLSLYQKGVYYTGIKLFNKLPNEIKDTILTPSLFKNSLKRYLLSHCFYELEEYYAAKV